MNTATLECSSPIAQQRCNAAKPTYLNSRFGQSSCSPSGSIAKLEEMMTTPAPGDFFETPTLRLLEIICGLKPEQSARLSSADLQLGLESTGRQAGTNLR